MLTRRNFIGTGLAALAATTLAACGNSGSSSSSSSSAASDSAQSQTLTVAASPSPHAEILNNFAAPKLKEQGIDLQTKEYTDYIIPNQVTSSGEVDANYFQHINYLNNYNDENGADLVGVAAIHYEPFGIYAGKSSDLANIADGAQIAVPNDPTNEGRALLLLQQENLITLKDPDAIERMLILMGAPHSAREWTGKRTDGEARGKANRLANFDDANMRRSAKAAAEASEKVRRAFEILGDDIPENLRAAGHAAP